MLKSILFFSSSLCSASFLFSALLLTTLCAADDQITVPALFALTGDAAAYGEVEVKGATLALEELNSAGGINGKKLTLRAEDTQSTSAGTITAYRKLRSDRDLHWIIGPTWLDSYQGLNPIAPREKVLLLSPSASMDVLKITGTTSPFIFSTWFSLQEEAKALGRYIKSTGISRISLISDEDPFFHALRVLLNEQLKANAISIVDDIEVPSGTEDFRSLLTKMKHSNPEAVFFCVSEKSLFPFLTERRQLWQNVRLISSEYIDGYARDPSRVHEFEGVEYSAVPDATESFSNRYRARFGIEPVLSAAPAYDAVMIVAEALRALSAHGAPDAQAIGDYFRSHEFNTASFGKVHFTPIGSVDTGSFQMKSVKEGVLR